MFLLGEHNVPTASHIADAHTRRRSIFLTYQPTYFINRKVPCRLRPRKPNTRGVNTVIWTPSKTLAVVIGAFIGVWASYLMGAAPIAAVLVGLASALVIFLLIRKR